MLTKRHVLTLVAIVAVARVVYLLATRHGDHAIPPGMVVAVVIGGSIGLIWRWWEHRDDWRDEEDEGAEDDQAA